MPKKKANKSKKPISFMQKVVGSIKSFYDTRTWTKVFLSLLALWGLVWCGQVAVERYRFYDAEKKLDELASELQKELGSEYELKKERSCDYSSVKYGRGDRSCSVGFYLEPVHVSLEEANRLAKGFKIVMDRYTLYPAKVESGNLPFVFKDASRGSINQGIGFSLTEKDAYPDCGGGLSYTIIPESIKREGVSGNDYLHISFSCHAFAKFEYFPVKD